MILVRNVFQCKPGKAKDLVATLQASAKAMKSSKLIEGSRVMTDAAAGFWTVVFETEHASLEAFEKSFAAYGSNPLLVTAPRHSALRPRLHPATTSSTRCRREKRTDRVTRVWLAKVSSSAPP